MTPDDGLLPYREVLPLNAERVTFSVEKWLPGDTFWRLSPENPLKVEVTGPARVAVESRLLYPETESRRMQSYRIFLNIDEQEGSSSRLN